LKRVHNESRGSCGWLHYLLLSAALGSLCLFPVHALGQLTAQQKQDIGFTALQDELGASMPTGQGLSASMIEAPNTSGNYRLNINDTQLSGKSFVFPSGGSTSSSSHATTVGRFFFGSSSLAPRIGRTVDSQSVANYEVNDWLGAGFLRRASNQLPNVETRDLQNHSWIGTFGSTEADTEILRRTDYMIQRDNVVATFGLSNSSGDPIPSLMASTYNGLVVGKSNGTHSRGTTTIDGTGRTKPDIVVPTNLTSNAAPTVASAAALLIETARNTAGLQNGDRSVVVKATLLAGASREGDHVPFTWSNTPTQPLNSVFGAGQLNIYESYQILTAGQHTPSITSSVGSTGWSLGTASATTDQLYFFDFDGSGMFSAALTWNRDITPSIGGGPFATYTFASSLANLDLALYEASDFELGNMVAQSISSVDNVELIYLSFLSKGRYALGVSSNTTGVDFGLAWQAIPEPGTALLLVFLVMLVMGLRGRRVRVAFATAG